MSRPKKSVRNVRLSLELPEPVAAALADLERRTLAGSRSEVIRHAIALYDFMVGEWERGAKTLTITNGKGEKKEVAFL